MPLISLSFYSELMAIIYSIILHMYFKVLLMTIDFLLDETVKSFYNIRAYP